MKTVVSGKTKEVVIESHGSITVIGECINPSGRKKLVSTLSEGRFSHLTALADEQVRAGAHILDLNVVFRGADEVSLLPKAVEVLQESHGVPLCLDTASAEAMEAALKVVRGRCIINAVTGSESSLSRLLPAARDHGAVVIGVTTDDSGRVDEPEQRLRIAEKILARALSAGMREEDVIIDPLTVPLRRDPEGVLKTLKAVTMIREHLGVNITLGISDVSHGMEERDEINRVYLTMALLSGVTCPIINPMKAGGVVRAAEALMAGGDGAAW